MAEESTTCILKWGLNGPTCKVQIKIKVCIMYRGTQMYGGIEVQLH
jgi:hypothetical protein